jgi:glycosyltransferase involved in cell wall biosynthesis
MPSERSKPTMVHLTASPCFGGVERQMLELGRELEQICHSAFVTFDEEGRCQGFVDNAAQYGFTVHALKHDFPRLFSVYRELKGFLTSVAPDLLCCHGYKSNLLGLLVARQLHIPIVSVSHGWTGESTRVKLFELLDKRILRLVDRVVCVSEGQAQKVRRSGVSHAKVKVIHDAVRVDRFNAPSHHDRAQLEQMFPTRPTAIVGAAGRLSPEKGFKHLIDAAAAIVRDHPHTGFVLFGDGPLREELAARIRERGVEQQFKLPGFQSDLDRFFPHFDLLVLPSYTEGLPNVVLEAFAAGVPVVATAVGGTPELVEPGENGFLVAPGDARELACRIRDLLADEQQRRTMGQRGSRLVREKFSFKSQAAAYQALIDALQPLSDNNIKIPEQLCSDRANAVRVPQL